MRYKKESIPVVGTTESSDAPLHERAVALDADLSPSERKVARFLADHPSEIPSMTAADLGRRIGTSDATVVRTVKALGYAGLPELKRVLLKAMVDRRDPARMLAQSIEHLGTDVGIADQVLLATRNLMHEARHLIDADTWRTAVDIIDGADAVLAYGIEQAGCVADFFAIELGRCGVPARSVTQTGLSMTSGLLPLSGGDAVLVIAPLRHFREIDVVIDHARSVGARVVFMSEALGMSVRDRVDVVLQTPQTNFGPASPVFVAMALAQALTLEIAARHPERAVATTQLVNELRGKSVGTDLDVDALPSLQTEVEASDGTD
ncbi:MurR/RpiR family transcriptional regulator [Streptomyces sp. NPDC004752]